MTKQPVNTLDQTNTTSGRFESTKQNLEQRDDFVGSSYRTIRDNPKTSAAIAGGVVAAAGAGAFLLNRKSKTGTAFGTARGVDSDIVNKVEELNEDPQS